MQFTKATLVAAIAAVAITVGAPERADAQQRTTPDTARKAPAADTIRKAPAMPVRKAPVEPAAGQRAPTDSAARPVVDSARPAPAAPALPAAPVTDSAAPPAAAMPAAVEVELTPTLLVTAIDSSSARVTALGTANVMNVQLVDVSELAAGAEAQVITDALTRNDAALQQLRTAIAANQAIAAALAAQTPAVDAAQVVAIDLREGGNVVVFYRKPAQ